MFLLIFGILNFVAELYVEQELEVFSFSLCAFYLMCRHVAGQCSSYTV
jgi:hypothetical protein